jgi:hypothetical protein
MAAVQPTRVPAPGKEAAICSSPTAAPLLYVAVPSCNQDGRVRHQLPDALIVQHGGGILGQSKVRRHHEFGKRAIASQ